jgi:tRNA(Ile)-lysidine synthetase-like protein
MTEIRDTINNLIQPSKSYVVALSGGVDSAVLLHAVSSHTENVRSVFVNHNQEDSNILQKSAEKFAETLNIQHINLDSELELGASETKMREVRYGLLFSNMKPDEKLLLGHHNDDKVETFLLNLFRGTRLKGLLSIRKQSQNILRPFIEIKKTSIIAYAKQNDIKFVDDSTNKDNSVLRNWLRNELIPDIETNFKGDLNNKIQSLILEIEELTKNENKLTSYIKHAQGYVEIPISLINKNDSKTFYLASVISQLIGQEGLQNIDLEKIFVSKKNSGQVSFFQNWQVSRHSGLIIFLNKKLWSTSDELLASRGFFKFKLQKSSNVLNNWSYSLPKYLQKQIYFCVISDGDLFKGEGNTKKVTELFRSHGVNKSLREVWPVLKLKDTILWIPGIRKSSEGKWLETQKDKFIISASVEKGEIENF